MSWNLPHMEHSQGVPTRSELVREFAKAEAELGNAIYMHRAAWVKARERRDELAREVEARHPADIRARAAELGALCETDPKYTRRLGDVKFWREERACLAATVTALAAMLHARPRPMTLRQDWTRDQKVPRQRG
jgi:hypothetical protein